MAAIVGEKTMYVNEDHPVANNISTLKEKIGHESVHNWPASMRDQLFWQENVTAHSNGAPEEKEAYRGLKSTELTFKNPGNYMEFVP